MQVYFLLALAILAETAGTTALQASQQFTRFWPSVFVVVPAVSARIASARRK